MDCPDNFSKCVYVPEFDIRTSSFCHDSLLRSLEDYYSLSSLFEIGRVVDVDSGVVVVVVFVVDNFDTDNVVVVVVVEYSSHGCWHWDVSRS